MNKKDFLQRLNAGIMLLDGATGTELQKRGMPRGVCPEEWTADHPDVIKEIQRSYIEAGSDIIYSSTFGGSRIKLAEYGLGDRTVELNRRLAQLSREAAAGTTCLVAGDLAPTGRFIKPLGDMGFEECVDIYKEQVKGLLEGGVDLFVIETMMDIQETRAALIAVKESCDLPVMVSMSYENNQRTLMGTDPVTALITLQSLGADVVGCNCSSGPARMLEIIQKIKPYAKVPLLAKPNAGLPKLIDGKTVFDMGAEEFGMYAEAFAEAGVSLLGGCCGTSPEYIAQLHKSTRGLNPVTVGCKPFSAVTSTRGTVFIDRNGPVVLVGERINPTGKKKLQEEFRQGHTDEALDLAMEQIDNGAAILDVNVGMPGINEKNTMVGLVSQLSTSIAAPLCLDSSSPEVLEAALRIYPGRALINSISNEKVKLEKLLPIAAKYGAMFILLPLGDGGVPETAEGRREMVASVYEQAVKYGYGKEDIVIDGLVMTVSANQEAARETLKLIEWADVEFGCPSIVGLSNVSFGLPERGWVNSAFLAMAIDRGLTMAIANPSTEVMMNIKAAGDVLTVRDLNSSRYIERFAGQAARDSKAKADVGTDAAGGRSAGEKIYSAVLKGSKNEIGALIDTALKEGMTASSIVDDFLIPAINKVGEFFNEKTYFLPQLIQSAEAMKAGFDITEPLLVTEGDEAAGPAGVIVLATVKGDIHDIGKNIVGLMLKNYGYKVHDLGKDCGADLIISEAQRTGADIIGLSALMTTTMTEMETVVKLAKEKGLKCRIMIGGAVVDEGYALEIGADGYSADAYGAVLLAGKLTGKLAGN